IRPIPEQGPGGFVPLAAWLEFPQRPFPAAGAQNNPRRAWAKAPRSAFPEGYFRQLRWISQILLYRDTISPMQGWRERHAKRAWQRPGKRPGLNRVFLPQGRHLPD